MKKIIVVLIIMILITTACTNTNSENNDLSTDENDCTIKENKIIKKPRADDDIDRSEYLTGEIITDGEYSFPSKGFGIIYFIPDEESSKIIKEKYNVTGESLQLKYADLTKIENLSHELGIYKVKVNIEHNNRGFILREIQLTDIIGTVLYEGKDYETNELDENVKVKDNICGLIVKWIIRDDEGGMQIRFAGEIESEGYYTISNDLMYGESIGRIYFDEEYPNNIPFIAGEKRTNFSFFKTNMLFDELQSFSSFGKGRFKVSNYSLIYNIGMGRPVSEKLTEIISLDEDYKDMFIFDGNKYLTIVGDNKDFVIVSAANYDEGQSNISTDYYYINNSNPEKIFLFNSVGYNYKFKQAANRNEFILLTDGYNYLTGEKDNSHIIKFTVIGKRVVSEKIEN